MMAEEASSTASQACGTKHSLSQAPSCRGCTKNECLKAGGMVLSPQTMNTSDATFTSEQQPENISRKAH